MCNTISAVDNKGMVAGVSVSSTLLFLALVAIVILLAVIMYGPLQRGELMVRYAAYKVIL